MSMVPKRRPPVQSAPSATVTVSSPDTPSFPCTTTLGSTSSGAAEPLQALHRTLTDGTGENVTTIWSPSAARPVCLPAAFTKVNDAASGVTAADEGDGALDPTALMATTLKV